MMLGGMIGVKAAAIVGFDDVQPLSVEGLQGKIVSIEVVENAEFHSSSRLRLSWDCGLPSSLKAQAPTRSAQLRVKKME
jgi:hypothetical protein